MDDDIIVMLAGGIGLAPMLFGCQLSSDGDRMGQAICEMQYGNDTRFDGYNTFDDEGVQCKKIGSGDDFDGIKTRLKENGGN